MNRLIKALEAKLMTSIETKSFEDIDVQESNYEMIGFIQLSKKFFVEVIDSKLYWVKEGEIIETLNPEISKVTDHYLNEKLLDEKAIEANCTEFYNDIMRDQLSFRLN